MSKITFRADDDLVDAIEAFDASKSEVMRRALRAYLESAPGASASSDPGVSDPLDAALAERVDRLVDAALADASPRRTANAASPQDVNVTVAIDGLDGATDAEVDADAVEGSDVATDAEVDPSDAGDTTCGRCGTAVDPDHVYCPNCGEKISRRVFCECGDEIRSDWSFCPSCGTRTPAADVLDGS